MQVAAERARECGVKKDRLTNKGCHVAVFHEVDESPSGHGEKGPPAASWEGVDC